MIRALSVISVVGALMVAEPAISGTIFVNAAATTGANDGTSWANAFQGRLGLATAIEVAETHRGPTEIWVAAGTYAADAADGDIHATFELRSGMAILGGFAGSESSASQRDPNRNVVVFSGDLNANDGKSFLTYTDNVIHVVFADGADGSALLDGVTITAGRADGPAFFFDESGAGMMLVDSSPTLTRCRFVGNEAQWAGGGLAVAGGQPQISACEFLECRGNFGGGIHGDAGALLTVTNSLFSGNLASAGAGVYNQGGAMVIADCDFIANGDATGMTGAGSGVGVFDDHGAAVVERCRFHDNRTVGGGGGVFLWGSATLVRGCDFVGNAAAGDGGGGAFVLGDESSSPPGPTFSDCRFTGNNGSLLAVGAGAPATLINCTIVNNAPGLDQFNGWPTLISMQGAVVHVKNSIVFGNAPLVEPGMQGILMQIHGGVITADASCIELFNGTLEGDDVMDDDPIFADLDGADNIAGTFDDDVRLAASSPCIDSGDGRFVLRDTTSDLACKPRVIDGDGDGIAVIDLGCFEARAALNPADLNGDGMVNGADLGLLLGAWDTSNETADLNGDGEVDGADLGLLLSSWSG